MNNEQTKNSIGQTYWETFNEYMIRVHKQNAGSAWDSVDPRWQEGHDYAASRLISHVLQGAKWVLLEIGEEIRPGDEFFDYNRPLDFRWVKCSMGVVGDKIDEHHFIHRRPISLTHGATEGDSTTPPVSSGDAGTDVPAGMEACPMCGGLGDDESHRIAMLGMGEPSITKPCSLCRGSGVVQSAEPVVEDDEKPSLELMTASRNEYYEMYAAQRSYAMGLESERDQLRKELEEARQRLTERTNALAFAGVREIGHEREIESLTTENTALKEKLDRWQAVGNSVMKAVTGKEGPLSDSDVEAELTRLRSQFRWTPISERLPTEKDGQNQGPFKHEVLWADGEMSWTGGLSDTDGTHWMPLPPIPSPPETEEQTMRREFEEWIDSDESPSMDRAEKEIAWLAFQAAKQSTGGQA